MKKTIDLANKNLYLAELDKVHRKLKFKNALTKPVQGELTILDFLFSRSKVCRTLAKLISKENYLSYNPKCEKHYFKNTKRIVCDYNITDKIVQGVLFKIFSDAQQHYLSDNVYSYMGNRNARQAVEALSNYLKDKPLAEQIYVFSADIFAYSDAIPIHEASPLWQRFNELDHENEINVNYDYIQALIKNILRPILYTKDDCPYQNIIGIPMGSPFALLANNIYLKPVDDALLDTPELFYARYCDQFIVAHTDLTTFKHAEATLISALIKLKLSLNAKKFERIQLTANQSASAMRENIKKNEQIELLGFNINSCGGISANQKVLNSLLRNIFIRMHNCAKLLKQLDLDTKGKALCAAVNIMLNPRHELCEPQMKQLLYATTDKLVLKDLDDKICLKIAELCSEINDNSALKIISCRKIYDEWGLMKCHQ